MLKISNLTGIYHMDRSGQIRIKKNGSGSETLLTGLTYLWTQWAAVAICQWLSSTPPHWYELIRMCT